MNPTKQKNSLEQFQFNEMKIYYIKSYPILLKLNLQDLQVKIIELVLSYQTNDKEFYMNYSDIAEILSVKTQSIKNAVSKLAKSGYLKTINKSNFNGVDGGSSTYLNVDMDAIINTLKLMPKGSVKETPSTQSEPILKAPIDEMIVEPIQQKEMDSDQLQALKTAYDRSQKYARGNKLQAGTFHGLTNDEFLDIPFLEVIPLLNGTETFEGLLNTIKQLKQLKQVA